MTTRTEQLANDLPLAGIVAATEVAQMSGGQIKPALAEAPAGRDASRPRNPSTAINEDQHELLADVWEIWAQVEQQGGVIPATMLNMHGWPIHATGPHNQGIIVPPCPIQDEYIQFVQRSPRFDFGDRWGKFKVRPVWPIQIMRDFERQHFSWQGGEFPSGGLVVYMGEHLPGQIKTKVGGFFDKIQSAIRKVSDGEIRKALEEAIEKERSEQSQLADHSRISDSEILVLIKAAREQQVVFYEKMFDWADQRWAEKTRIGYSSVTVMHRTIARWLHHRGRVTRLPEWVTEKKAKDFVQSFCPKCGGELSEKGYACAKCGRVNRPFLAFKDGAIKADDPSMKRCSREELDSLGLTDLKTVDEELVAAQASEKKPKSGNK